MGAASCPPAESRDRLTRGADGGHVAINTLPKVVSRAVMPSLAT